MAVKSSEARVQDALRAWELWWLLDGSRSLPEADEAVKLTLQNAFLAGVLYATDELNADLRVIERRLGVRR